MTLTPPFLPPELKASIAADCFDHDKAILGSLSQVSREWRFPAQAFLLRKICIPIIKIQTLQEALLLPCSSLSVYITEIGVYGDRDFSENNQVSTSQLVALATILPNLRCLALYGEVRIIVDKDVYKSRSPLTLALTGILTDIQSLTVLLSHFSGGSQLMLDGVMLSNPASNMADIPSPPLEPEDFLALKRVYFGMLLKHMSCTVSLSCLYDQLLGLFPHTLSSFGMAIDLSYERGVVRMNDFLRTKARHLKDLQLDFATPITIFGEDLWDFIDDGMDTMDHGFGRIPTSWRAVSLSESCPALQVLTIAITVKKEFQHACSSAILYWRFALQMVASSPRTIKSIRIGLYVDKVSGADPEFEDMSYKDCTMNGVDWRKWDEVLGGFEHLEELVFFRMEHRRRDQRHYEPMISHNPVPEGFIQEMRAIVGEGSSISLWQLVRFA
ncbi:hypothetical protein BXZ70DRAFT_938775 [Cristinia sonorae]|uniref:Uncharacterized protein n=1 Tax=Cristinia sonorae TaxID=1940300 RepID=A0A8K0XPG9_9AGAR|nr:hypothetical protein BXZ70DRAFT_938775 [Cristinia sonorae]